MGSPGTYGLSAQKAKKVRDLMAGDPAVDAPDEPTGVPRSARARKFFAAMLSDPEWRGLLSGQEWRAAASLLAGMVVGARISYQQHSLEQWMADQGIGGETALVQLGSQLLERLDQDLAQRDLIGFELASYALRRTVEELYAQERSPFDVDGEQLLRRLPKVDSETALQTYIGAYLQELARHVVGGLQAETVTDQKLQSGFMESVGEDEGPRLAKEFLETLRQYSARKYGSGRPISEVLEDVPEWLHRASKELLKGDSD